MTYEIVVSNQFKKDLKTALRRGLDPKPLKAVVDMLAAGRQLDETYRDHSLTGEYRGFRECHVAPDRLLVYRRDEGKLLLFLFRTGTHADLF